MKKLAVFALTVLALATATVSAQTIEINISSPNLWLGDSAEISCSWDSNVSGFAWGRIVSGPYEDDFKNEFVQISENKSIFSFQPEMEGMYQIKCTNGSVFSGEAGLEVADLSIKINEYEKSLYSGDDIEIRANVYETVDEQKEINDWDLGFDVYLDNSKLSPEVKRMGGEWVITVSPGSVPPGTHILRTVASYKGAQASNETSVEIIPEVVFNIESLSKHSFTEAQNVTINIDAEYRGSPIIEDASFSVFVDGNEADMRKTQAGIVAALPELPPGEYELEVVMNYNGETYSRNLTIAYLVPFHGKLLDAEGKSVPARIRIMSGDSETASVSVSGGQYSTGIKKGTYDILFETKDITAAFRNVKLDGDTADPIRFDNFESVDGLQGIDLLSGFALEFVPEFENAEISVEYDGSRVSDETKIKAYKCSSWNIDSRSCAGGWEEIDPEIDVIKNRISFSVTSLSAFIIGEQAGMTIEASIDKSEYSPGEKIKLTGVIRSRNRPVTDASVTYLFSGMSGTTRTNSNGVFSANIDVPEDEGSYTLVITASKEMYTSASATREFSVKLRRDFSILLPLAAEVKNGSSARFEISVINTGQTSLNNLSVKVTGIPDAWFTINPSGWDRLDAGEERKITLLVSPVSPDRSSYIIGINVTSAELSKTDNFVMNVIRANATALPAPSNQSAGQSEKGVTVAETLNSFITANSTALINNGSIAASLMIILYIIWKLRTKQYSERSAMEARQISSVISHAVATRSHRADKNRSGMTEAVKHEVLRRRTGPKKRAPGKRRKKGRSRRHLSLEYADI